MSKVVARTRKQMQGQEKKPRRLPPGPAAEFPVAPPAALPNPNMEAAAKGEVEEEEAPRVHDDCAAPSALLPPHFPFHAASARPELKLQLIDAAKML